MTSKSSVDRSVGRRIRTKRKAIGMSQSELASSLGVSFQQIQKYESGVSGIAERRLTQICDALGLPLSFFVDNAALIGKPAQPEESSEPNDPPAPLPAKAPASDDAVRLMEAFTSISDAKLRSRILDFVLAVASDHAGQDGDAEVPPG